MISSNSFFHDNQPQFSQGIVDQMATEYLFHFRHGKMEELTDWMRTKLIHLGVELDVTDSTVHTLVDHARKDVEQALQTDPSLAKNGRSEVIGHYSGFEAITIQRLAHFLYNKKIVELPRALTESVHRKTGIDIHPGAKIGEYFFIDHGTGIVIGETVIIGNHVVIYHGVTLGNRSEPQPCQSGSKRHPTVEDEVTIFAGATVLGGDTVVHRGAKIGAKALVMGSVPEGHIVHSNTTYNGEGII